LQSVETALKPGVADNVMTATCSVCLELKALRKESYFFTNIYIGYTFVSNPAQIIFLKCYSIKLNVIVLRIVRFEVLTVAASGRLS
jgi:hypothetical protein